MLLPLFTASLIANYHTFIFDIDGTLRNKGKPLDGAVDFFNYIVDSGRDYAIITNNIYHDTQTYVKTLTGYGFVGIKEETILTPPEALLTHLEERGWHNGSFYVISKPFIKDLLRRRLGATVYGTEDVCLEEQDDIQQSLAEDLKKYPVKAVIVSECSAFNMVHLSKAVNYLRNSSVEFFVLDSDLLHYTDPEFLRPAGGTMSSILEVLTERKAINIGKPGTLMGNLLQSRRKFNKKRTLMFGDNAFTDVEFANRLGIDSVLLTRSHNMKDIKMFMKTGKSLNVPTYFGNFSQLVDQLKLEDEDEDRDED